MTARRRAYPAHGINPYFQWVFALRGIGGNSRLDTAPDTPAPVSLLDG
jgi:hypothetical protein